MTTQVDRKCHIQVELLVGRDKGKQGKVVVVDRNLSRLYVQGLNTVSVDRPGHIVLQ